MSPRREFCAFAAVLAALIAVFLHESLFLGKVLSAADVLYATRGFEEFHGPDYEPANRLLMDPVLQFQPWLEFNRTMLWQGRLPLWNDFAGCGTPHLANGQSAVFDPFHIIAYLGTLPDAYVWMAAARLWVAGIGAWLLARRWGYGPWGRWFAGLAFPFCGFLVGWLLYPVTSVAIWLPWAIWATDKAFEEPGKRTIAALALIVGCVLLAGHIQTSAHVLMAAFAYLVWKTVHERKLRHPVPWRALTAWSAGVLLGMGVAAITILPLGAYLARSPVWTDRAANRPSVLTLQRPRGLDAVCTALPYVYGSQRRGQPNLAPVFGVRNLNETAGGFAGLATLLWLAPSGWRARRERPIATFLLAFTVIGFCGAFDIPPVANLLRSLPVLDVIKHRRMTLWVAFGLVFLGGAGLDALIAPGKERWAWLMLAAALVAGAIAVPVAAPIIRARAIEHYAKAAASEPGADFETYRLRAERQARLTVNFVPRYAAIGAGQLGFLVGLAQGLRMRPSRVRWLRPVLMALVLIDLFGFGLGLNPAIARADDRPVSQLIAYLRREAAPPSRILALGAELPPNTLMRYGLSDVRNYDSIESARTLAFFEPLFEPAPARSSRREVTWAGVARAIDRLRAAGVQAIVAAAPPPPGLCDRVDRVGTVWVGKLESVSLTPSSPIPGEKTVLLGKNQMPAITVNTSYEPGWQAEVDGQPANVRPDASGAFLTVDVAPSAQQLVLRYRPVEVRVGGAISLICLGSIGWLGASRKHDSRKNSVRGLDARRASG